MLEDLLKSKNRNNKRVLGFTALSFVLHMVIATALVIQGFWVIEKLVPPRSEVVLALEPPPPPPPPARASKKKRIVKPNVKRVVRTHGLTQPVEADPDEPQVEIEIVDDSEGVEGGVEGGVAGGVVTGVVGGTLDSLPGGVIEQAPPPPPPPAVVKPKVLAQAVVEQQRLAGETNIEPDEMTKRKIERAGKSQTTLKVRMCLNTRGEVSSLTVSRPSGYAAYDSRVRAKMRKWRYSPYLVDGQPAPVCTTVTFIYRQL